MSNIQFKGTNTQSPALNTFIKKNAEIMSAATLQQEKSDSFEKENKSKVTTSDPIKSADNFTKEEKITKETETPKEKHPDTFEKEEKTEAKKEAKKAEVKEEIEETATEEIKQVEASVKENKTKKKQSTQENTAATAKNQQGNHKPKIFDNVLKFLGGIFLSCLAYTCIFNLPKIVTMLTGKMKPENLISSLDNVMDFEKMQLPKALKEWYENTLQHIQNPKTYENHNITKIKPVLLHGVPGTGKTTSVKAFAKYINADFIEINAAEISSSYQSGTAINFNKKVKQICEYAEKHQDKKIILFIDEADTLIMKDESINHTHRDEITNTVKRCFTEELDKKGNIITICATNRKINTIDDAMVDRFDLVEVGLPPAQQLKSAIINRYKDLVTIVNENNKRTDNTKYYTSDFIKLINSESEKTELEALTKDLEKAGISYRDLETIFAESANNCAKNEKPMSLEILKEEATKIIKQKEKLTMEANAGNNNSQKEIQDLLTQILNFLGSFNK